MRGRGAYLSGQLDPVHFRHLYVGYLPRSIRRLIHTKTTFRLVADGDGREELELLRTLRTTSPTRCDPRNSARLRAAA